MAAGNIYRSGRDIQVWMRQVLVGRQRFYGQPPYKVVVVHGGPGADGEMAPVARALANCRGVLEPIQTGASAEAQVQELRMDVERDGDPPVILVGFSWGAWLSLIVAARYPSLIDKLILIGSGPLEASYAPTVRETRLRRLTPEEREAFEMHAASLVDPDVPDRDHHLAELGRLTRKTDMVDPIEPPPGSAGGVEPRADIFHSVWPKADSLRREGELLALAANLSCPVLAIHGDYDPHPMEGVRQPMARLVSDFNWVLLRKCGHKPWEERQARDRFFQVLEEAIC